MQKVDRVYLSLSAMKAAWNIKKKLPGRWIVQLQYKHYGLWLWDKLHLLWFLCERMSTVDFYVWKYTALRRQIPPFCVRQPPNNEYFMYRQSDWHTNHVGLSLIVANFTAVHKSQLSWRRSIQNSKEILKEWDLPQERPSGHWSIGAV